MGACITKCVNIVFKGEWCSQGGSYFDYLYGFSQTLILTFYVTTEYCSFLTFISQFASAVPCSDGLCLEWFEDSFPLYPPSIPHRKGCFPV